ncbi:serine hydrolase domain-containing protein [Streptomyces griseiscabiei]|uniref:Serine hydrolase n=2 Tax=Streptomyces griseiscabiei TaxID=2993540 RepID=A0ABU4LHR3_9ACTN|nr:serine hydrolase domain-containing protein [Streptomyces griseiscabiei]MBZ3908163.1 beta-lactamase family protein [Streptomyces griseiscabiei]MDX2915320.1 serine hydrolase [Streptomyces griseiscabiei]
MRTPICRLGGAGISDRVAHGHDADRFVEIGSLTKVVTGTVLARLEAGGGVGFDTPLEECLDDVPRGTGITLRHLAEHTSGLPRLPRLSHASAGTPGFPDDPYAGFTETALREQLRDVYRLRTGRPGEEEYSNLGYAVLGLALTSVTGRSYQELVDTHVLLPLGLAAGSMTGSPPEERRLVPRDLFGRPRPLWTMTGAILPAGGLWSGSRTLADLVVALLVDRRFGEPAPSWQRGPSLRWHDGATRASSVVAAAYDDGRWVLVHRLGTLSRTGTLAKRALLATTAPQGTEHG